MWGTKRLWKILKQHGFLTLKHSIAVPGSCWNAMLVDVDIFTTFENQFDGKEAIDHGIWGYERVNVCFNVKYFMDYILGQNIMNQI